MCHKHCVDLVYVKIQKLITIMFYDYVVFVLI